MAILEEAERILQEWNNGVDRGAKANSERALNISRGKMTDYLSGRQNPSEETIQKMAKLFNKSEEEIKRIKKKKKESFPYTQNNIKSKGHFQQIINEYKGEAIAAQLRVLEAKIDLLIQLVKRGK